MNSTLIVIDIANKAVYSSTSTYSVIQQAVKEFEKQTGIDAMGFVVNVSNNSLIIIGND